MKISDLYSEIFTEQQLSLHPRFVIFRPMDQSGWGNRIRALMLCYLIAICSRRILLVNDFLIEEHFAPPEGTDWSAKKWRKVIAERKDVRIMNLHLRPDNWDEGEWRSYESKSLDEVFPESVIILEEGASFAAAIIANKVYASLFSSLSLNVGSRTEWVSAIVKELLSRPRAKLLDKVAQLSKKIGFPNEAPVGIQFRTFFDIGHPNSRHLSRFVQGVADSLSREGTALKGRKVYVTTDDRSATAEILKSLGGFAECIYPPYATVHTGGLNQGLQALAERVLVKLFGSSAHGFDFWFWLPPKLRPRVHTRVLAEWYLLGECDPIYSTFTSFAIFAAARRGNNAKLWKYDTAVDEIVLMTDRHYDF